MKAMDRLSLTPKPQPVSQLELLRQFAKTLDIEPEKVAIHANITTVEDEIAFFEQMIQERLGIKAASEERETPGPTYESTVIKEKDLLAYLKKARWIHMPHNLHRLNAWSL